MGVLRIGHVNLRVLDMQATLHHYENVLGLIKTDRDGAGNVYLKGWDEWDQYSIMLSESDRAGMNHIAFKVENDADLDVLKRRISDWGIAVEEVPAGSLHNCGRAIRFNMPSGHEMYLYAEKKRVGKSVGTVNPHPWPQDLKGAVASGSERRRSALAGSCSADVRVEPGSRHQYGRGNNALSAGYDGFPSGRTGDGRTRGQNPGGNLVVSHLDPTRHRAGRRGAHGTPPLRFLLG
jgi:catechol 2,3-dioxygenase-like lactoylglutathione lyase family enzyme